MSGQKESTARNNASDEPLREVIHDAITDEHSSLISRALVRSLRFVLAFPIMTVVLALVLGAVSVVLSATSLGYKSGRTDLINQDSSYQKLWRDYVEEFGGQDDAVIVVQGNSKEEIIPALKSIAATLEKDSRLFKEVLHEVDLQRIRAKGLYYLAANELNLVAASVQETFPILHGEWTRLQVGKSLGGLMWQLQKGAANNPEARKQIVNRLESLSSALLTSLRSPTGEYTSPLPSFEGSLKNLSGSTAEYLLTKDGKTGFVMLHLDSGSDKLSPYSEATDVLRRTLDTFRVHHPDLTFGLTGLPVMENDEMRSSQDSMLWSSIYSFVGVVIVIVIGFGGLRHALLANLVLLLGMAWSFGYATLAVGHLNILSITFTATLIGIGIDYGTYYISRYIQERSAGLDCFDALIKTTSAVGQSILTGALTTAVAFFAAAWTSFTGVSELGIIAGGGLLLCAVAQLYVLPAVILLVDRSSWGEKIPVPLPIHTAFVPFWRKPKFVICACLAIVGLVGTGSSKLYYDSNLLNLQADGLESVKWERKLIAESDQSVWYAISIADSSEELLKRKADLQKLSSVERVEEIASLIPVDSESKQPLIQMVNQSLKKLPDQEPLMGVDLVEEVAPILMQLQALFQGQPDGQRISQNAATLLATIQSMPAPKYYSRVSAFQQNMATELLSRMQSLQNVSNPEPPSTDDVTASLVHRFVGKSGKHLLRIYGRGEIWNQAALEKFVTEIRTVDSKATGNPFQAFEASREMKQSYQWAALYAVIIIGFVLWIDFQNLWHCFLASIPLLLCLLTTFGLMGWLDQPLNPANMIALPMLLGIGIDYGVHIVHNYLESPTNYKMTPATALAIMVDALTTVIGFGSLLIASHQGLQSLGRILSLSIAICTLMAMIVLPVILSMLSRRKSTEASSEDTIAEASLLELMNSHLKATSKPTREKDRAGQFAA